MKHLIAPSLLAADFCKLAVEVEMLNGSEADWIHIDIMDGQFVPNISYGFPVLDAIKGLVTKPLDVHLMILEPQHYIKRFRASGAASITVHVETCVHLHSTLQQIKETGAKAGVALNPHTPISEIEHVLDDVDLILIMSVNPGFGGQKFIYRSLHKIAELRTHLITRNLSAHIQVDGGVGLHNAERILQAGADVLVAGSAIFKADAPTDYIHRLKSLGADTILI
ncbi:MAG: ribulose-phosphate 3-epimerase [Saprospiraceae bacterium]|nr:ribulose-phosphate 3-epimerase [Saprospiraceae bacterium]